MATQGGTRGLQEEGLALGGLHDLEREASCPLNIGCEGCWPRGRAGGGENVPKEPGPQTERLCPGLGTSGGELSWGAEPLPALPDLPLRPACGHWSQA